MALTEANLAALIGSRICHDLISPIGAINNGLELLGMTRTGSGPEMDLISQSVGNASARIRYFRIAFGAAGTQEIGAPEIRSVLNDNFSEGRINLEYLPQAAQSRTDVRLVFLAILCLETALAYGGQISVTQHGNDWKLKAEAEKLNLEKALWQTLARGETSPETPPAQVQFVLLPLLAQDANRKLDITQSASSVIIRF